MKTPAIEEKGLPCNTDVERLVLGCAVRSSRVMDDIRGTVEADDFHLMKHQRIWSAACHLYDQGQAVDRITVFTELKARGEAESCDGLSYLVDLDTGLPEIPSLEQYLVILREKRSLRRLLQIADLTMKRCLGGDSSEEIGTALSNGLTELAGTRTADRRVISTREMIDTQGIEELLRPRRHEGIPLPWEHLNKALCGLHPGQMIVLAGVTGRGKTSMALQIASHATRHGKSPVIWALEMSAKQMFTRAVNQIAHIDADRGRQGVLPVEALGRRKDAAYWLHGHPMWFDRHSRSVASFCASVRHSQGKSEVGLAIVDYLQLIRGTGRGNSRAQEVGENSRALKLAAMELGVPILVLSQFRRTGDAEPDLHDLKESGDIENDSDVILLLKSPKSEGNENIPVAVKVAKQREGPAGFEIPLIFHPPSQSFSSPEDM